MKYGGKNINSLSEALKQLSVIQANVLIFMHALLNKYLLIAVHQICRCFSVVIVYVGDVIDMDAV